MSINVSHLFILQQYAEEEVSVVDAAPVSGYDEQSSPITHVERSGYRWVSVDGNPLLPLLIQCPICFRFKRSNAYGDELVVPVEEVKETVNAEVKVLLIIVSLYF